MNLCEAFRALNALNEDTFSVDADGINKLSEFEQSDDLTDEISIIDPEAETEDELSDSYIGKVILDCCVCHSKLYKSKEDVTLDDEGLLANVGEECPYCYTPDGFKVIGEVAAFGAEEPTEKEDDDSEELLDSDVPVTSNVTANGKSVGAGGMTESLNEVADKYGWDPDRLPHKGDRVKVTGFAYADRKLENKFSVNSLGTVIIASIFPGSGLKNKFLVELDEGRDGWVTEDNIELLEPEVTKRRREYDKVKKDLHGASVNEGIFNFGKKKKQQNAERARKEQERQRRQTDIEDEEDQRGAQIARDWKEREDRQRQARREYETSRYNSIKGDRSSNTGYRGVNYSGGDYYSESLKEASAVATRPSIASVLSKNMDSLYSYDNANELRNAIMDIVNNSEVDPKEIAKLQRALFSKKSVSALLSTIGTYMTGERVVDTTGRNAEMNNSVNESVNNITIETDEDTVDVAMDGNGGVTVNTTPTNTADSGDEVIAPVSDETMTEIEGNDEPIEEPVEGEEMDVNLDEFDEDSFDELGESYFKRIYENVDGYTTTAIKERGNQLIVEGTIKFNSGNLKKTSFVFEALDIDKNGRARFVGDNVQITDGKKAFTVTGSVKGNKFITESLNYNYRDKGTDGKSTRVYGTARVIKRG